MDRLKAYARAAAAVFVLAALAGCHQDMWNQPKYKPLTMSTFFGDTQASRALVAGVVPYKGARTDDFFYRGREGDQFASTFPAQMRIDEAMLRRGKERYEIFCTPCHGVLGDGKGFVASRGFETKQPANMHEQRLREMPPGYFFDVITNGFGTMYSYASRVNVEDRWAIVAYIQALQVSQNASLADVPESERNALLNPQPQPAEGQGASEYGTAH